MQPISTQQIKEKIPAYVWRVLDALAAQGYRGYLVGGKVDADVGRFEHSPALVHGGHVVAQHGHVGYLASGMKAISHGLEHTRATHTGQAVHMRGMCMLQQGFIV